MSLDSPYAQLYALAGEYGDLQSPPTANHILTRIQDNDGFDAIIQSLRRADLYLVTVVANDERELEDQCFKLYYLFSHPSQDLFLTVEFLLEEESYPSIFAYYPAVDSFEREIRDLFGLKPAGVREASVPAGSWLHAPFPSDLYPLRRGHTSTLLKKRVEAYNRAGLRQSTPVDTMHPGTGSLFLSVGPIHAGVIEPGRYVFQIAGEVIDELAIYLGYTHKGIERLFQAHMTLAEGWRLAEQVSGDSAFAHSLAYCRAAEALAGVEPTNAAELLRGLFLELERIYNHIGDIAALAHDVALNLISSELGMIREKLVRMHAAIARNRYLCGLNRPGGIVLPCPLDAELIASILSPSLDLFQRLAETIAGATSFRERAIGTGILTRTEASSIGVTGLPARALAIDRDYRRDHPIGVYCQSWLREPLATLATREESTNHFSEATHGDVYARFLTRVHEIKQARGIVEEILTRWRVQPERGEANFVSEVHFNPAGNYTFAIGYAEGWRGDIVYWLMQDKMGRIYRCKVRDPSQLNWEGLRRAVIPHEVGGKQLETILPDFPLINKSFNLSYSGNDL